MREMMDIHFGFPIFGRSSIKCANIAEPLVLELLLGFDYPLAEGFQLAEYVFDVLV
jgi:hypothetical protein